MALIDKASLLMVPSTYEAGKLYNVLPSGNRAPDSTDKNNGYDQTRADFDFDRGSNAAATRVNAAGLIEKYRENLLLQSNNFGTTWATTNASVTSGQIGYDSNSDAWELKENTSSGVHEILQTLSVSTGIHTYSVKVSSNTRSKIALVLAGSGFNTGGNGVGIFNLTNGTLISSTGSLIDAKITSLGGGWFNVSITKLASSSSTVAVIQLVDNSNNTSFTGNGTGSIFIQDAQLESGLVATDYLNSGATTAKAGVLVDLPRINYDANGNNGALLLEPQRANLITHSEYANSGGWGNFVRITALNNQSLSPEGLVNATKINETAVNNTHIIDRSFLAVSGTTYTLSYFAKAAERTQCYIFAYSDNSVFASQRAIFDLSDGTITSNAGNGAAKIEAYTNGWYRVSLTVTSAATSTGYFGFGLALNDAVSYAGVVSNGALFYGIQLESGATFPSSYIPNHGTSGGVTRAADSCTSSSITTSTDFSIIFEAKDFCLINGSVGGSYDHIQFVFSPTGGPYGSGGSYHIYANQLYYFNGSTNTSFGVIFNSQTDSKFALVKRGNKGIIYANGVKKTEITLPSGADAKVINWDTIDLTQSLQDAQGDVFGSNYKQLIKFNEALSDSELATLTTL